MRLDVVSIYQNPKEAGSNASEGMDLPVRERASRQRANILYVCCSQIVWLGLKVGLPTLNDLRKNSQKL